MKILKPRNTGFSFIEVIVVIALIGGWLTAMLGLQSTVIQGLFRSSGQLQRMLMAKSFLQEETIKIAQKSLFLQPNKALESGEKKVENITLKFLQSRVEKKSPLTIFPELVQQQILVEWKEWDGKQEESLITFSYRPQIKEKQAK